MSRQKSADCAFGHPRCQLSLFYFLGIYCLNNPAAFRPVSCTCYESLSYLFGTLLIAFPVVAILTVWKSQSSYVAVYETCVEGCTVFKGTKFQLPFPRFKPSVSRTIACFSRRRTKPMRSRQWQTETKPYWKFKRESRRRLNTTKPAKIFCGRKAERQS